MKIRQTKTIYVVTHRIAIFKRIEIVKKEMALITPNYCRYRSAENRFWFGFIFVSHKQFTQSYYL